MNSFIFITFLKVLFELALCSNNYDIMQNASANSAFMQKFLIASIKNPSKLNCLVNCNLNDQCLSAQFNDQDSNLNNCFLFNNSLNLNLIKPASNSNLFNKKSKFLIFHNYRP